MTATISSPTVFTLEGPLPAGTCILEASAGTGKTFTIAALAVRYIAEQGRPLTDLMIVTFSRVATAELRTRVFERISSSRDALAAFLVQQTPPEDPVDALLCQGDADQVRLRLKRLQTALAGIDEAMIATTHQFCATMLSELGVLVDHDGTATFADEIDTLVEEAVVDCYLSTFVAIPRPSFTIDEAKIFCRAAIGHSGTRLEPAPGPKHDPSLGRVEFADRVRLEVDARKRRQGVYTFGDMVSRLLAALTDPVSGERAARVLSRRFPLVLIDEFQDTDPAQWAIVRSAFVGRSVLVLIGDPKQAIYSFRDADVAAYLQAVESAHTVLTLSTNHRSDEPMTRAVDELFGRCSLGDQRILVRPVGAAHPARLITGPDSTWRTPLRVRTVGGDRQPDRDEHRDRIAADVVAQVDDLLGSSVRVVVDQQPRAVRPADIAVLVQTNATGKAVHAALVEAGLSAVFSGVGSVFGAPAAADWRTLLAALAEPRAELVSRAGLTRLIGWSTARLAGATTSERSELSLLVKRLSRVLTEVGVAGVFELLCQVTDLYARCLQQQEGERTLTDLRQLSQELNDAQRRLRLAPPGLLEWLDDRVARAKADADPSRAQRVETERDAVQVMTIHRSKGLEFPFVMLPDIGSPHFYGTSSRPFIRHTPGGERVLDIGPHDKARKQRAAEHEREEQAEALRKLYVALTRARSSVTLWWQNVPQSPVQRLLYARNGEGREPGPSASGLDVPPQGLSLDPDLISFAAVPDAVPPRPAPCAVHLPGLPEYRGFDRTIDTAWRRTSYSGLTATVHQQPLDVAGHEADESTGDEPAPPLASVPVPRSAPEPASALAGLPGGTAFGSLVHAVLEQVDPASPDLSSDIAGAIATVGARIPVTDLATDQLTAGLVEVLNTPLGPLTQGRSLAELGAVNRLAELDFEFGLANAVSADRRPRVADLADLFCTLVSPEDPLAGYGSFLARSDAASQVLAGFLTGSIDAVVRVGTGDAPRYVILDYKTNRLVVPGGEQLGVRHYDQAAMAAAMIHAHYPLQALLYTVALHRFLTVRQPGYRPERHLGGVGYLFVRGMAGPATPVRDGLPHGVFTWFPQPELVVAASELLAGLDHPKGAGRWAR